MEKCEENVHDLLYSFIIIYKIGPIVHLNRIKGKRINNYIAITGKRINKVHCYYK